jgi:hypothetical protein
MLDYIIELLVIFFRFDNVLSGRILFFLGNTYWNIEVGESITASAAYCR